MIKKDTFTVLIVEDEHPSRKLMIDYIEKRPELEVAGVARNGKDAIQKLIEIDPNVKGIVSSGHCEDPVMNDFGKYGFCSAISKPYSIPELSVILDKVITDEKSAGMS